MSASYAKKRIDTTEGPIFSKMVYFVVPLILTNLIQQLYTVADNMVVGNFSSNENALGAIGSSTAIIAFLTALFAGFSVGTAAVVSHDFGGRDRDSLSKSTHTSLILSLAVGLFVGVVGFIFARPILTALNTKPAFLNDAVVYMKIRCVGITFVALYNSSAAVLRSVGDSKTPLYILTASGLANVILNLVFVICFGMGADGVAYATLASQVLSVVFSLFVLTKRSSEAYSLKWSRLRIDAASVRRILKFAIPGTIQGSVAHIMNVFLTSAANIFSGEIIEARTVASNIDTILSTIIATYATVSITFTGQNRGANKPQRAKKALFYAIIQSTVIAFVVGQVLLFFREPLINLFVNESVYDAAEIVKHATTIMSIMLPSYIISGITNSLAGFIKGLGHSLPPMVVSLLDMGVVRAIWIFLLFPLVPTLEFLYFIYPVSWGMNLICYAVISIILWKKYIALRTGESTDFLAETRSHK